MTNSSRIAIDAMGGDAPGAADLNGRQPNGLHQAAPVLAMPTGGFALTALKFRLMAHLVNER